MKIMLKPMFPKNMSPIIIIIFLNQLCRSYRKKAFYLYLL